MKKTLAKFSLAALMLTFSAGASTSAQSGVVPQEPSSTPEAVTQRPAPPQDPIAQLNLTPEQRQQIRTIRIESVEERAAINRRLRETKIALDAALDAVPADEALIETRAREAGEARAALLRFQARNEARIRRVLTPEQLKILSEIREQQAKNNRRERQEKRAQERGRTLPNDRNGILPGRRNNPLKRARP
ncbi:MAG TPA: Spy/CpxP family protein refolding chaperone [Pyrinomonadaceae bacterium]|nr:Spy/CpxP family protein refolding chaperone [Pyrinomonadaceae bacterium]